MTIKLEIKNLIEKAISMAQKDEKLPQFDAGKFAVIVDKPQEKIHGDYSNNIALRLSGILKRDACEIATIIGDYVLADSRESGGIVSRIEVAHPGFLNIFLSEKFIQEQIKNILKQKEKFGLLKINLPTSQRKVLIEFLSANPTGQLHLGHGRSAFFGDVLANVLKKAGYNIKREYYINDAKASTQIRMLGQTTVGEGEIYLNDYLRQKIKNQSASWRTKIKNLSKKNKDKQFIYSEVGFLMAGEVLKDLKRFIEKDLKIKFDIWFSEEKELYVKKAVGKMYEWFKEKDLIYEKEGAEWLKLSQFGDSEDRIIIRSDENKTPTYLLPDIAYHQNKIKRGFGRLINIWGADHQGHVKSMKAAMKMLNADVKFDVSISQMVLLKEGSRKLKLSKRKGKIVTMESLVKEVGLDSVRFFYLLKSLDTQMELDLDLMKEQSSKNPVFYVQYAHARIASIIRKTKNLKLKTKNKTLHLEMLSTESELDLMKELLKFPELIEEIAGDYQVHRLTHYAISLADKFHHFYHECKVISDDELLTGARLALITTVKITLKNTLDLLGVSAPEKM